jgi:hypothetical protein
MKKVKNSSKNDDLTTKLGIMLAQLDVNKSYVNFEKILKVFRSYKM